MQFVDSSGCNYPIIMSRSGGLLSIIRLTWVM